MTTPAQVGTNDLVGNVTRFDGVAGTGNGTDVLTTNDVSRFDDFTIKSDAGAMNVYACLDDSNFYGPVSLQDLGATTSAPVTVTAAQRIYRLQGRFRYLQLQQNGATAVAGAVILAARIGAHF